MPQGFSPPSAGSSWPQRWWAVRWPWASEGCGEASCPGGIRAGGAGAHVVHGNRPGRDPGSRRGRLEAGTLPVSCEEPQSVRKQCHRSRAEGDGMRGRGTWRQDRATVCTREEQDQKLWGGSAGSWGLPPVMASAEGQMDLLPWEVGSLALPGTVGLWPPPCSLISRSTWCMAGSATCESIQATDLACLKSVPPRGLLAVAETVSWATRPLCKTLGDTSLGAGTLCRHHPEPSQAPVWSVEGQVTVAMGCDSGGGALETMHGWSDWLLHHRAAERVRSPSQCPARGPGAGWGVVWGWQLAATASAHHPGPWSLLLHTRTRHRERASGRKEGPTRAVHSGWTGPVLATLGTAAGPLRGGCLCRSGGPFAGVLRAGLLTAS